MGIVFFYAVLGGMKGITYTQVAQYCVLIFAYMVPAIFLSMMITGIPIPQIGLGAAEQETGTFLLDRLNGLHEELGFAAYTDGTKSTLDVLAITAALMVGTAGLPARDHPLLHGAARARRTHQRGLGARVHRVAVHGGPGGGGVREDEPAQYGDGTAVRGDAGVVHQVGDDGTDLLRGPQRGWTHPVRRPRRPWMPPEHRCVTNSRSTATSWCSPTRRSPRLPNWVVGLVAAGGLAAALSTAAGLLLVLSAAISHDLLKRNWRPDISEKGELIAARVSAGLAVFVAGYLGVNPPGFVAEVVAFAFGLAAASFFPVIILGIFSKRLNREGAIAGMLCGITLTAAYIVYFKFVNPAANVAENWWFGISPEGIGALGMAVNFTVASIVSRFTPAPPPDVQRLVDRIRVPRGAGEAHEISG